MECHVLSCSGLRPPGSAGPGAFIGCCEPPSVRSSAAPPGSREAVLRYASLRSATQDEGGAAGGDSDKSLVPSRRASAVSRACSRLVEGSGRITPPPGMSWNVMFPIPSPMLHRPVPAYRASIAFRSVPAGLPSVRQVPLPRISRERLRAGPGGRIAAARFARLIARARQRAHISCPFRGSFSNRRRGSGFWTPPPLVSYYHRFSEVKHFREIFQKFSNKTLSSQWRHLGTPRSSRAAARQSR